MELRLHNDNFKNNIMYISNHNHEIFENYLLFDNYEVENEKVVFTTTINVEIDIPNLEAKQIYEKYYDEEISIALDKLNEKSLEVINLRFYNELTLADTGEKLGITRERVRQIEEQVIRKLSALLPGRLFLTIGEQIENKKILFYHDMPIVNKEFIELLCNVLSHKKYRKNYIHDKVLNALVAEREYTFHNLKANLLHFMRSIDEAICSMDELKGYLLYLYPRQNPELIINILFDNDELLKLSEDSFFFQNLCITKREKVEFVYSLYENGFESSKNLEELKEQLNKFFPNVFINDSNRAITGLSSMSDKIVLWEWGKHIHIKNIQDVLQNYDFSDLLEYIDSELKNILAVDLDGFYRINENSLKSFGIPTKYALHTMLKLKYPEDYSYQDSPRISSSGTGRLDLGNVLLDVMTEKRIYSLEELMNSLNTPRDRIQQLIERVNDVIVIDTFKYIKKAYIEIPNELLHEIVKYANEEVKKLNFLYIGLIINKFRDRVHIIGEYNVETTLLELLKKNDIKKEFNISNHRIVNKAYPITRSSLNFHYLLEQFMEDRDEISKNELFEYFYIRGLDSRIIMNYYMFSKLKRVARIDPETFVKLSSIGLTDENIRAITPLIETSYNEDLPIDDLLIIVRSKLPKISIKWNKYLLSDILDKNIFKVIPSSENPQYLEMKK